MSQYTNPDAVGWYHDVITAIIEKDVDASAPVWQKRRACVERAHDEKVVLAN